jgi:putative Holliday junction resolvase
VRLGIDPGSVRIGVARCDPDGLLATPLDTVQRGPGDLDRLVRLALEHDAIEVLVGLPTSLSGREGAAAGAARSFANELAGRLVPIPVRLVDERFTTVQRAAPGRQGRTRPQAGRGPGRRCPAAAGRPRRGTHGRPPTWRARSA